MGGIQGYPDGTVKETKAKTQREGAELESENCSVYKYMLTGNLTIQFRASLATHRAVFDVDGLHKGRGHSRAAVIECQTCLLVTLDCHMSHQSTRQRLIIYVWEGRPRT